MKDILKAFLDIEQMKGKGSQKLIMETLQENWSDELEYVINIALNQFKPTHLNKLNDVAGTYNRDRLTVSSFKHLIDQCLAVKSCTNELRANVTAFVGAFDNPEHQRILTMIVTKNLNIGLGRKLVNKAMKRQVLPTPEAHLANKDLSLLDKWICSNVRVNIKYDGYRLIARHTENEGWSLFTRNFNEFDKVAMNNIISQLNILFEETIREVGNFFVDGELILKDAISSDKNSSGARQGISSIANSILKGGGKPDMDKDMEYVIFDIELNDALDSGSGKLPYQDRRIALCTHFDVEFTPNNLTLAKEWILDNNKTLEDEIKLIYDELISNGEEGVIIKDPTSLYECGRMKSWLKMKEIISADVRVKECIEGTGKNVGKLGAVTVEFETGQRVNVGSGFSDMEREVLWANKYMLLDHIIEIEYNAKCKDKHGKESLFIPVFKKVRLDKTEADKY